MIVLESSVSSDFYVISREYGIFQFDTLTINITSAYFGVANENRKKVTRTYLKTNLNWFNKMQKLPSCPNTGRRLSMNSVSVTVILVRLVLFIDQLPDERLQCLTHDSMRKALINSSELNETLRQIDVRPVRRQCNIGK